MTLTVNLADLPQSEPSNPPEPVALVEMPEPAVQDPPERDEAATSWTR